MHNTAAKRWYFRAFVCHHHWHEEYKRQTCVRINQTGFENADHTTHTIHTQLYLAHPAAVCYAKAQTTLAKDMSVFLSTNNIYSKGK